MEEKIEYDPRVYCTTNCWEKSIIGSLLTEYVCTPIARNMERYGEMVYIVRSYFTCRQFVSIDTFTWTLKMLPGVLFSKYYNIEGIADT